MKVLIKDIQTFITRPGRSDLVVVKVITDQEGLYGLGCATFTQRAETVKAAVDTFLRDLMIGFDVSNIEDAWQFMYGSSYWRNGPVLNNAISGIDMALWDIKGKMANMPVYELLGGRSRYGARIFQDAMGSTIEEVGDAVEKRIAEGFDQIRLFLGGPDANKVREEAKPDGAPWGKYYDPKKYMNDMVKMFRYMRERFGEEIDFMIDVHERLTPAESIMMAKALEPYHPFFLEDPLAPEQLNWLERFRQQVSTPVALGELFNNVNEYRDIIARGQIDFIRCHISQLGGITPARKLAALAEFYDVKTIWHYPGDISPIGTAATVHLDLAIHNFGLQEFREINDATRAVFPGAPELKGQYIYINDKPGLGVDFNEEEAARYPGQGYKSTGFLSRLPDGTSVRS